MVDAVKVPVIATDGIADSRGVAAALLLGASAFQVGTGFLRSPEAKLPEAWADALASAAPEDTLVTRAFSGRAGRSLATAYARGPPRRADARALSRETRFDAGDARGGGQIGRYRDDAGLGGPVGGPRAGRARGGDRAPVVGRRAGDVRMTSEARMR